MKVVFAGPELAGEDDQVARHEAAADPLPQQSHRVRVRGVEARAQPERELDVGTGPAGLHEVVPLPEADRLGQLLARDDPHRRASGGRVDGRLHERGGHAAALRAGSDAEPPQHQAFG